MTKILQTLIGFILMALTLGILIGGGFLFKYLIEELNPSYKSYIGYTIFTGLLILLIVGTLKNCYDIGKDILK